MSHCTYATSCALKEAGLPQPTPEPGQLWWVGHFIGYEAEYWELALLDYKGVKNSAVFAPTLEYIVPLLPIPELFHFEIWNNTHSCRFLDDENPRRTFGETFTEAAAKMYLELKQNAPTSDFSKMGDAEQE